MTTISSIDARSAQTAVGEAAKKVTSSVENLVSGVKSDANVADLSVGTGLASRVNTLRVAIGNAGQGKSVLNTAKGALNTIIGLIQQQKSLSVKAADDSLSDNERGFLNQEFQAITTQIDRIASTTNFNNKKLIDGSIDGTGSSSTDIGTKTGITNEQDSLLNAKNITSSSAGGVITSGDLSNSHATVGRNLITFGAETGSTAGVGTITIDADGTAGSAAAQSVTFAIASGGTAIANAASFVAAVNAKVSGATDSTYSNFAKFTFVDNGDGTVGVTANEAGAGLNNYYFKDSIASSTVVVGFGATAQTPDVLTTQRLFTAKADVTGADGIFKTVDANSIANTSLSSILTFGSPAAADNGVKTVKTFQVTHVAVNADTFDFDGVTFTCATTPNSTTKFGIGTTATTQAQIIADALSSNATTGALYTFTTGGTDTITATLKNYSSSASNIATYNAQTISNITGGNLTFTSVIDGTGSSVLGVASADVACTLTVKDDNGVTAGTGSTIGSAITFTISANTGTTAYTASDVARFFVTGYNAAHTTASRLFTVTDTGAGGIVNLVANESGTRLNEFSLTLSPGTDTFTATVGTGHGDITSAYKLDTSAAAVTLGTNRTIAPASLTYDPTLEGAITNLTGTFTQGAGNNGVSDVSNNTVRFTVDVGGKTYTSQSVILTGSSTTSTVSNTIAAGTLLTFTSNTGPVDSSNQYTNAGFQLKIGSATTLTDVTTPALAKTSLDSVIGSIETQLDQITINQSRSLAFAETDAANSDHTIKAANGTALAGIRGADDVGSVTRVSYGSGDITLSSNLYASDGTHGRVGQFTVDSTADTISTTINGEVFTAYLNSNTVPATGGVQVYGKNADGTANKGSYNAATKIITTNSGGSGVQAGDYGKLNFYSANTSDGRVLTIDLKHVTDTTIDLSTAASVTAVQDSLDAIFGTATSSSNSSSLTFQVGVASTDTISVKIGNAGTAGIFKDANGVAQTISVDTKTNAIAASDVLDRALNTVVALVSTVSASITAFDASIQNNNSSVQNADAARSTLLDTDYTAESTNFAEARVRTDAATAVLAQINTRAQNLLTLLRQ